MLERELETALALAAAASQGIMTAYAVEIIEEVKRGADNEAEPVTEADRAASRLIVEGLRAVFPDDAILSEEEIDPTGGWATALRAWIIDPIDGTAGFIKKDGDFAVQIGLAAGGEPILGVVQLPFYDTTYYAVAGEGAFAKRGGSTSRLRTSDRAGFEELRVAMSSNHRSARMDRIVREFGFGSITRRGSVGLKIGLIADDECDIYLHPGGRTKLWDTCGPQAILEEAGGRLTDIFGRRIRYDDPDLRNLDGLLATNGITHERVLERLAPLLAEFGRVRANA